MSRTRLAWLLPILSFVALPLSADDADGRATGADHPPSVPFVPDSPSIAPETASSDSDDPVSPLDQVIADDLIVTGKACIGFDCINGELFGTETLKLKQSNTRIVFDDTSGSGFPANDWMLTANDPDAGGSSYFAIQDLTASRVPFMIRAAAPNNALFVSAAGQVGFRTGSPVLDLHIATGNTPAHRLEQTNASGFSAQTWDIGGNEANFFIRDVSAGSALPFRIRPGSPQNSVFILPDGVAIQGAVANALLDVTASFPSGSPGSGFRVTNPQFGPTTNFDDVPDENRFEVDSDGNVTARGAITQLSSRVAKENLVPVDSGDVLHRLAGLPLLHWNYRGAVPGQRHLGPTAEDFHAAFGLGAGPDTVALSDLAGVALAAVQALEAEVRDRDRRLAEQQARLDALEARLLRLEANP